MRNIASDIALYCTNFRVDDAFVLVRKPPTFLTALCGGESTDEEN